MEQRTIFDAGEPVLEQRSQNWSREPKLEQGAKIGGGESEIDEPRDVSISKAIQSIG